MHPSFVDVQNEFNEIRMEVEHIRLFLDALPFNLHDLSDQRQWEAGIICGSAAEKIYTGMERVMAHVTEAIDQANVPHAEGWHTTLLRRLAHPYPGVRDAVISENCYDRLNDLRAFRHRERNSYGFGLRLDRVIEIAGAAVATFDLFCQDVSGFYENFGA